MPRLALLAALLLPLAACGSGSGTSGGTDGGTTSSGLQPTYSDLSAKVFVPTCATGGCHDSGSHQAGLDLTKANALADLVGVPVESPDWAGTPYASFNRVTAGQPDQSALVASLQHPADLPAVLQMPPGTKLPQSTIDAVRQWITNGAKND